MYSIGQVAEMFGLPISTLRYYDKQGLLSTSPLAAWINASVIQYGISAGLHLCRHP